jgi:peptide/nickel transport system substrate-binding protein
MSLGLSACGGDDAKAADTFKIGSSTKIDTMNPMMTELQITYELILLIYDPLVRVDDEQEPTPCLAESWETSDDQLTWTFHLAEGVKWHDGEDFTSADVKYTYDLMLENDAFGYLFSSYLIGIEDVSCPDDYTVVLTTSAPKANILNNSTPILPAHIWEKLSAADIETFANDESIGTGPYKFDSKDDGFVKVVKNDDYFGTGGNVSSIVFINYDNTDSLTQALKLGEVDAATNLPSATFGDLQKEANLDVVSGQIPGFTQIGINIYEDPSSSGNPLLKNKVIRQAIEMAIDKQKVLDMCYGGAGAVGTTLINDGDFYHYDVPASDLYDFSTEKSGAALDAVGFKDTDGDGIRDDGKGNKLSFSLITISDNSDEIKAAQVIASGCKDAGIEINIETMDDGALADKIYEFDYDMFIWGWGADLDPSVILDVLSTNQIGSLNETGFSNARYDELYIEQDTTIDPDARKVLVDEMQKIAYEETPYILLIYDNNVQGYNTEKWTGMKPIPELGPFFFNFTAYNYLNVKPVA